MHGGSLADDATKRDGETHINSQFSPLPRQRLNASGTIQRNLPMNGGGSISGADGVESSPRPTSTAAYLSSAMMESMSPGGGNYNRASTSGSLSSPISTSLHGGSSPRGSDDNISRSSEPEPGALLEPYPARDMGLNLKLEQPEASESDGEVQEEEEELRKVERTPTAIDLSALPEAPPDNDDQEYSVSWYQTKKHIFVFSEAGKPIYSRYGQEEHIVSLYGVMQALLACVQDQDDDLQCIRTADHVFVFLCRSPLILVGVSPYEGSEELLSRQLTYLAKQTVFFLTQSHLTRVFKNRHNYDLRRQLGGLPKFFNGILDFTEQEISFLMGAVQCLPMPTALRTEITNVLLSNRTPELVFAILLHENQIVAAVRPKQYILTAQDLHLLMNYVKTELSGGQHGEKWAPCCLPDFNDGGFLYIHPSLLSDTVNLSLILLTNEKEQHINMIECKQRIVSHFQEHRILAKLEAHITRSRFLASDTKLPHLLHFIYKSKSSKQLVVPDFGPPYNLPEERHRLFREYCGVYDKLHNSYHKSVVYINDTSSEVVIGYTSNNSEIYCTFLPSCTRPVALNNIDKILRWIRKEESRFFIIHTGVY